MSRLLLALLLAVATASLPTPAAARHFWQDGSASESAETNQPLRWDTFTKLAERLQSAVVNIATT